MYLEKIIYFYIKYKEYKKFQMFIQPSVFDFIKEKKYKSINQINLKWKLNFDILFEI